MHLDSLSFKSGQSSTSTYEGSIFSDDDKASSNIVLYSELRLIERNEGEINVCWKGAHMLLFFMAFVFGSLCTCSFHRLMSMFDQKCVLYPKVVSHHSIHRIVYEFFSFKQSRRSNDVEFSINNEPTDYLTTQWADSSVCYLPTFVPLVSGLSGLVWTTMFLMCSSGTSNVTGSQRHWRALPSMFLFSVTMSAVCIYSSYVSHSGLRVLCMKMAEATGSASCSYNINVATLVYERRIHGVYQATRLCIVAAWLHTGCWVVSTLLVAARVLLAVDFTLVRVKAQLVGNLDDILQKHEKQIDSFNAESATPLRFDIDEDDSEVELFSTSNTIKSYNKAPKEPTQSFQSAQSPTSLGPEGRQKILDKYMHRLLHNLLKTVGKREQSTQTKTRLNTNAAEEVTDAGNTETLAKEFIKKLRGKLTKEINDFANDIKSSLENKAINDNTEDDTKKIKDDTTKYEATYKELKNKIVNIQYGEAEQGGTISSREIYAIDLEQKSKLTKEINDFEHEIKSSIENKVINDNTEDDIDKINDETKKYEATDTELKNKIDHIQYGETEQEGTISSKEIYAMDLEQGTSEKTKGKVKESKETEEKDKKSEITEDRDMSVEMLNVEYSNKSYDDLEMLQKVIKTNKDEEEHEKKDEEIELNDSQNKENADNAEQLHISADPDDSDDGNKSSSEKAYDKIDTNLQKKDDDDTKDGKESQDSKSDEK